MYLHLLVTSSVFFFFVSGGVHYSHAGFKWCAHAQGIQITQCMHLLDKMRTSAGMCTLHVICHA